MASEPGGRVTVTPTGRARLLIGLPIGAATREAPRVGGKGRFLPGVGLEDNGKPLKQG
jgi:hypothetical protein